MTLCLQALPLTSVTNLFSKLIGVFKYLCTHDVKVNLKNTNKNEFTTTAAILKCHNVCYFKVFILMHTFDYRPYNICIYEWFLTMHII